MENTIQKPSKDSIDKVLKECPLLPEESILYIGNLGFDLIKSEIKDNKYQGVLVELRPEIDNYICYLTHIDN